MGFGIWGLGFRDWSLGFGAWGLGLGVEAFHTLADFNDVWRQGHQGEA